jgi:L-lactate dehydrogenase complex protein LldE
LLSRIALVTNHQSQIPGAYDCGKVGAVGERVRERPETVYYYGTCLVDLFFPEAGLSGIRLLRREGLRVIFPQAQTCCGQPAFNCGYQKEAREVARAQISLMSGPYPIVVPSGSCAAMMKRHYPALFEGDPLHPQAEEFAARVYELTQFLADVLEVRLVDRGEKARVTWHSSCHALREMGIDQEPKGLLSQLNNIEIVPLARERECCGFGGTFAVRHPEISAAMVEDKAAEVVATRAPVLLSGDGGCLLNIGGRLEAKGEPVRSQHIAEFLWERTRGD